MAELKVHWTTVYFRQSKAKPWPYLTHWLVPGSGFSWLPRARSPVQDLSAVTRVSLGCRANRSELVATFFLIIASSGKWELVGVV